VHIRELSARSVTVRAIAVAPDGGMEEGIPASKDKEPSSTRSNAANFLRLIAFSVCHSESCLPESTALRSAFVNDSDGASGVASCALLEPRVKERSNT
jgi:hypothetical protein